MDIGWKEISNKWYYFNANGSMQIGWKKISGSWYYFNSNGTMRVQPITIGTRKYAFSGTGKLIVTEILISKQKQEQLDWCWAACAVMVGTYETNSKKTQSDIVKNIKVDPNSLGGKPSETVKAVNYASNNKKIGHNEGCLIGFDKLVDEIDNNRPMILLWQWSGGGGHMVVCSGYHTDGFVHVTDPDENIDSSYYKYDDLLNGFEIEGHKGTTYSTITYKWS